MQLLQLPELGIEPGTSSPGPGLLCTKFAFIVTLRMVRLEPDARWIRPS